MLESYDARIEVLAQDNTSSSGGVFSRFVATTKGVFGLKEERASYHFVNGTETIRRTGSWAARPSIRSLDQKNSRKENGLHLSNWKISSVSGTRTGQDCSKFRVTGYVCQNLCRYLWEHKGSAAKISKDRGRDINPVLREAESHVSGEEIIQQSRPIARSLYSECRLSMWV